MELSKDEREKLAELERHMAEMGEALECAEPDEGIWSMKVELVGKPGASHLWAVPSGQDWLHDALDEARIVPGTIYADDEPFLPSSIELTGYFQADADGRWLRIEKGCAPMDPASGEAGWKDALEDFDAVAAELADAMQSPEYRRMAQKAVIEQLSSCKIKSI